MLFYSTVHNIWISSNHTVYNVKLEELGKDDKMQDVSTQLFNPVLAVYF